MAREDISESIEKLQKIADSSPFPGERQNALNLIKKLKEKQTATGGVRQGKSGQKYSRVGFDSGFSESAHFDFKHFQEVMQNLRKEAQDDANRYARSARQSSYKQQDERIKKEKRYQEYKRKMDLFKIQVYASNSGELYVISEMSDEALQVVLDRLDELEVEAIGEFKEFGIRYQRSLIEIEVKKRNFRKKWHP